MNRNQFTSKEFFNALNITFLSLIFGQIFFAVIAIFLNINGSMSFDLQDTKFTFLLIAIISAFAAIYGGNYFFRLKLQNAKQAPSLYNKLVEYRAACIAKWAILETPSFFAIIGYFLTADMTFLIITIAIISFFLMNRPGPEKTCVELELDDQHKFLVLDPDSIISEGDM